ncbi:hypothetical protein CONLIGDRAFT_572710 [Coniochaeta ligniaria NRRL 30616]|uniref:Zinc transporter n=1 Tax=Coniochaeta ligniaria NRRL 30616 TaxID=1408157 RepID=A0A1J7IZL5_9PEZI|nr:hypothetical protein CONLIGDRAFT_572710 [Coniochaeta ligniaria NRRL 30616]
MDSAYSLPTAAIPTHHHHHSEHLHHHSHTHSHSPPSLSSFPPSISGKPDENRPIGASLGSSRRQSLGHRHSHTHDSYRANSNQPLATRPHLPTIPSSAEIPSVDGHWRTGSTAGGRPLITPTHGSFDAAAMYQPPEAQSHTHHDHDHGHEHDHNHDHAHDHHDHDHTAERSAFTALLLPYTSRYPLLHAIMTDKDSRRIFYFMSLNFSFMTIQAFYGYATDSLGLLSDSIHMFFDCVALAVGLFAAVASKWPPSERFPYGFGKIETLSGFANGVFLVLISVEIMIEAFERIIEGRETKRLTELFVVSTLGLLVNLVGMAAFGHHHHGGHDHGGHGHGGCSHGNESHKHEHEHGHDRAEEKHAHGGHSHDNENMHGIYLHVLADTLGSGAVIASTVLTHFFAWSGWDPLASFLIAVLILLSAVPLVKSAARRLLLTIPDEIEYGLRDTLSGILGLRGVASYGAPRFWVDDRSEGGAGKLLGVMHVVAVRGADVEDVGERVRGYMLGKGIDITVQVEREGEGGCWCGLGRSPLGMHQSKPSGVLL